MFILANVITDLEPLYFILTNQWPLHRFFHTYLGATIVAVGCIALGRPACYKLTDLWNTFFRSFKISSQGISQAALVTSAFVGTYSHVLLDSFMHGDMRPLYPFRDSNHFLLILSYGQLHLLCVLAGIAGIVIYCFTHRQTR